MQVSWSCWMVPVPLGRLGIWILEDGQTSSTEGCRRNCRLCSGDVPAMAPRTSARFKAGLSCLQRERIQMFKTCCVCDVLILSRNCWGAFLMVDYIWVHPRIRRLLRTVGTASPGFRRRGEGCQRFVPWHMCSTDLYNVRRIVPEASQAPIFRDGNCDRRSFCHVWPRGHGTQQWLRRHRWHCFWRHPTCGFRDVESHSLLFENVNDWNRCPVLKSPVTGLWFVVIYDRTTKSILAEGWSICKI